MWPGRCAGFNVDNKQRTSQTILGGASSQRFCYLMRKREFVTRCDNAFMFVMYIDLQDLL